MDAYELELKTDFLKEASELLIGSEKCFLGIESAAQSNQFGPELEAIYDELFRVIHNIKGSAAAVGLDQVKEFSHLTESIIVKVRKKIVPLNSEVANLLLKCNDRLSEMFNGLKSNLDTKFDNTDLVEAVVRVMNPESQSLQKNRSTQTVQTTTKTAQPTKLEAGQALSQRISQATVASSSESIRVSLDRLDRLLNYVGELVIIQESLQVQFQKNGFTDRNEKSFKQMEELTKIIREIQRITMGMRMVPLKQTFQKMQRIIRDTSKSLGKEIIFYTTGEETEIDKTVLERLSDPLVHLIRNAADHGLESSQERKDLGKSEAGTIHLSARHQGGSVVIEVRDDGRGLNPKKLIEKAIAKGIIHEGVQLSESDAYQLIFAPGFSTKEEVSEISGRGVGMDVVRSNIKELSGTIEIDTEVGKGTCFRVILPLTLAIIEGMIVRLGEERYVVPIASISESVKPKREDILSSSEEVEMMSVRGERMPLFRLAELLGRSSFGRNSWDGVALVIRDIKEKPFSLLVDEVVSSQQIVIKPLGHDLEGTPGIAGGAILGDGDAALILNIHEIAEAAA